MNPFEILGLKNNASMEETKRQFRKLSLRMHPDKGGDENQYVVLLNAYELIMNGYIVKEPEYKSKPKENISVTSLDVFITLDEGFNGCHRNIYLKDGTVNIEIPAGVLPMQVVKYIGYGEMNSDGIRGALAVTIRFIMPDGFTFEKHLTNTVLVYSIKFKNAPEYFNVTVNSATKKIKMPTKIHDGMFLKIKDFGYVNNGNRNPLFVRLSKRL